MSRTFNLFAFAVLFPLSVAFSAYYDFESLTVPSLPAGWSGSAWTTVASGNVTYGKVLSNTAAGTLSCGNVAVTTNAVVSFIANVSGAAPVTLTISAGGTVSNLTLAASGAWNRQTVVLPASVTGSITLSLGRTDSGGATLKMDAIYVGRQLKTQEAFACTGVDGIGTMWNTWGNVVWTNNVAGFVGETKNKLANLVGYVSTIAPIEKPSSDSLFVSFELQNSRPGVDRYDKVQVVASTNDWSAIFSLGDPILIYDANYADSAWRSITNGIYVAGGLKGNNNLRLGFSATAAGNTAKDILIRNVKVFYKTTSTPHDLEFCDAAGIGTSTSLSYGGDPHVGVSINYQSLSDITDLNVSVEQIRGTTTNEYTMVETSAGSGRWVSSETVSDLFGTPFESGETNKLIATVSYNSILGFATDSPETLETVETVTTGLSSVWINEVGVGWIELGASVGRSINGWVIRDGQGNTISSGLDNVFTNVLRGVGLKVFDANLPVSGTISLFLYNSAGICEHSVTINLSQSRVWAATGRLPWLSGDWTGAGTNFTWTAVSGDGTSGQVNNGQSFDMATVLNLTLATTVTNALCKVTAHFSGGDVTAQTTYIAANIISGLTLNGTGVVSLAVQGYHDEDTLAADDISISVTAFGWAVLGQADTQMQLGATVANMLPLFVLEPSVGEDGFEDGLDKNWIQEGTALLWSGVSIGAGICAEANTEYALVSKESRLRSRNTIQRRGRGFVSLEVDIKNTYPSVNRADKVNFCLSPTTSWDPLSAASVSFQAISNKISQSIVPLNGWATTRQVVPILESNTTEDFVFALQAVPGGNTTKNIDIDNLRLAFQDVATAENLVLTPAVPRSGDSVRVNVDVLPWGGSEVVSNVCVTLWTVRGGVTNSYPFAWYGGGMLTNEALTAETSLSITNGVIPVFVEGETFDYWVEVEFDTNNADLDADAKRESRYLPDNSVTDSVTGIWSVTGDYKPVPVSRVAWGVQPVWLNEVCPNPQATPTQHFVELAGYTNLVDITGWTLEVRNLAGGGDDLLGSYTLSKNLGHCVVTNGSSVVTNDYGFYVLGGSAVAGRDQLLTNALPAKGGLVLLDSENQVRYACSYVATGAEETFIGYEFLGSAASGWLYATGAGNPANSKFGWVATSTGSTTPGLVNPSQLFVNGGPNPIVLKTSSVGVNSVIVSATAADLDKPVQYLFFKDGAEIVPAAGVGDGNWTLAITNAYAGLSENTEYTLGVTARDSKGNLSPATNAVSLYTRLNMPVADVWGTATNAVSVYADLPNMDATNTAFYVEGFAVPGWTKVALELSSTNWGPNSLHSYRVMARNGDEVETAWSGLGYGYTLALAPTSTVALAKTANQINLDFSAAYDPETDMPVDGNPRDTEYSVMTELAFKDGSVVTNYIALDGNTSATNCWATLPAWQSLATNGTWGAHVDITATNIAFRLVACNGDYIATVPGPEASTFFEMAISHDSASQILDGNGLVLVTASLSNPWTNACNVGLNYSTNAGVAWAKATLTGAGAAYGDVTVEMSEDYQIRGVETYSEGTNTVETTWDALTDLESIVSGPIWLKWDAVAPGGGKEANSAIMTNAFVSLDLEPPSVSSVVCNQTSPTKVSPLTFTVTFDEPVTFTNNAAITVSNGTNASATASSSPNTTWIISVTPSSQGVVSVTSIVANAAADIVGNRNSIWSGSPASVTYDSVAPAISNIAASPSNAKLATQVMITFTASDATSGISGNPVVKVGANNANYVSTVGTTYTYRYTIVAGDSDGSATISVTAVDVAGNSTTLTDATKLKIDKTAPVVSTIGALPSNAKLATQVTITFTASDATSGISGNPVVKVGANNANYVSTVGTTYTYRYTIVAGDSDGSATISVTAVDVAGNSTTLTDATKLMVDKTAPVVSTIGASPSNAKLATLVTLTFTATDATSGISGNPVVKVGANSATYKSKASNVYTYEYTVLSSDADGMATISVTAVDVAGNSTVLTDATKLKIDKTAPVVSTIAASPSCATNGALVTITFTASDATSGISGNPLVQVGANNATHISTVGTTYTYRYTIVSGDADGLATISVTAIDVVGNSTLLTDVTKLKIDKTAPVVSTIAASPSCATNGAVVTITFTASDATSGISGNPVVKVGANTASHISTEGTTYTYHYTIVTGDADGLATISVTAIDVAGNSTILTDATKLTVDKTAPVVSTIAASPSCATNGAVVSITFTASDATSGISGNPLVQVRANSATYKSKASNVYTYEYTVLSSDADGMATISVTAVDVAGNSTILTDATKLMIDKTAPVVSTIAASPSCATNGAVVSITFTASDATSGISGNPVVQVRANSATYKSKASNVYTYEYTVLSSDGDGMATISVTAVDVAGNSTVLTDATKLKIDKTAPVVSTITASPSCATNGALVTITFTASDATSGISGNPLVQVGANNATHISTVGTTYTYRYTIVSGDADGLATISVTAIDVAGNSTLLTDATRLTIDKTAPIVSIIAASPSNAKLGTQVTITFTASDATSGIADNPTVTVNTHAAAYKSKTGTVYTYEYTVLSGDADGVATISVTAVDAAGNSTTLTDATKLAIDKTAPVIATIAVSPSCAKLATQVTLTFTASDATSGISGNPTVTVNGNGTAYISKSGNLYTYRYTVSSSDPEGPAAISVTAVDVAANSRNVVETTKLTIDKTAPVVANIAASPSSATLGTVITITFDASDALCGITNTPTVTVNTHPATYKSKSSNLYTYEYITLAGDPEEPATISVTAVDRPGNSTTITDSDTLSIDLTAPAVTLKNTPSSLTNDGDVCATVSANDVNYANGLTMRWRVGLAGVVATLPWIDEESSTLAADQWIVRTSGLLAGTYQLQTEVEDEAGNVGFANYTWEIDRTAPTCTVTAGALRVSAQAVFTVTFSKPVHGLLVGELSVFAAGATPTKAISPSTGTNAVYTVTLGNLAGATAVGLAVPALICNDSAGNGNTAGSLVSCIVDTTAPVIKNVVATPARVKPEAAVTLEFDVVDDSALTNVTVNGIAVSGTPPHYTYTFNNTGSTNVIIIATDALANVSTLTNTTAFVVDNIAPTFTWMGMPTGTNNATSFNSTVSSIVEADPNRQYMWTLDGTAMQAWTLVPGSGLLAIAANGFADGSHTAVVTLRDSAGNMGSQTNLWTVDTTGPAVSVTAGAQGGNGALFTVTIDSGATLNTNAVYATTTTGLTAEIGPVSGSGTNYTVVVTNIFGSGTVTVTAPAGSVKDVYGNGNLSSASNSMVVSYTTTAPKVSLAFSGRQLDATKLQWTLSSDQPLTGLSTGKFSVKRAGVADVDVSITSVDVSTPATNAVISVTENDWKTADSYQPFTLVFNSDGSVTSTNGITAGVITNIATEANLLIDKHGGTVTDPFNGTPALDRRIVDGVANGVEPDSASSLTAGQIIKYDVTNAVVRKIGFTRTPSKATILGAQVTIFRPDNTTFVTNFSTLSDQDYIFDIPDVVARSVQFSNILPINSVIYINELAAMGCPTNNDTTAPTPRITLLGDTQTTGSSVQFRVDCDEDNRLGTGKAWSNVIATNGVTGVSISVVTNGFGRSYVVTLTGLSGSGAVALSLPEGFFVDAVGNGSPAVVSAAFTVDQTKPTAEFLLPVADNTIATSGSVVYRIQFSEPIHGLDLADFSTTTSNAAATLKSIAQVSGATNVYDILVAVSWSDVATVSLSLGAGAVTDALGNVSVGAVLSKTYKFEKQPTNSAAILVVVNAGANGFTNPTGTNVVASGGSKNIVITADEGYKIATLTRNLTSVPAALGQATYTLTLTPITSDITVAATFQKFADVTVTLSKTGNGILTPASTITVPYGGDTTVVATADAGNRIKSVTVGGVAQAEAVGKTDYLVALSNLTTNITVAVVFEKIPDVTLTVTAGEGGTASPSGTTTLAYGGSTSVVVTATADYVIQSVSVNGVAKPAAVRSGIYHVQLLDMTSNVTVNVVFELVDDDDPNEIPFGNGSIWIIADAENPVSFGEITFGTPYASVRLDATIDHNTGATTEDAYLIVQTELGSTMTNTLEGSINTNGTVEFEMPSGHDKLFFIGIGNSNWRPLQEF